MKYGFVYIWLDRKHKRYYIGCHWGAVNDGYICSSTWMRDAYKRRKDDFRRRILVTGIHSREELLKEEHRWLNMIKGEELGKRYYNLANTLNGHWSADGNKLVSVSDKLKAAWARNPERRNKRSEFMKQNNPMADKELSEKVATKNRGRTSWNKGMPQSEEQKKAHSERMKGRTPWNKKDKS